MMSHLQEERSRMGQLHKSAGRSLKELEPSREMGTLEFLLGLRRRLAS